MSSVLAWLLLLLLDGVLGTVVVLVLVMCAVAIWWLRQAPALLPWLSLALAPVCLGYAILQFQHPRWVAVLVLAGVVFFSVQLVLETCPSRQTVRRFRAARQMSLPTPVDKQPGENPQQA